MPNENHLDTNQALEQRIIGVGVTRLLEMVATYFKDDRGIADPIKECMSKIKDYGKRQRVTA
jgi:hypothetical protein